MASVTKTLERYQRCCYTPQENSSERETQSWYQEATKLKAKDLGPLNVKELQNLEKQLEGALALARQRKQQVLTEQMEDLRKKERHLGDLNRHLKLKLEAEGQNLQAIQDYWNSGAADGSSNFHLHHSQSSQMDCDPGPVLQIGYHQYFPAEGSSVSASKSMPGETNFFQGWVL
ncbi:hypothetical protein OIU78_015790 [Salix suchowensis]|nr:hypothetical protein OIU78_015790 [Salix suchowensis]